MKKETIKKIREGVIFIAFIVGLILVLETFGLKGLWGLLVLVLLISAFGIYRNRDMFMQIIRNIETTIWGKPLEKEWWGKEKLPKIKIRWKRKKKEESKTTK